MACLMIAHGGIGGCCFGQSNVNVSRQISPLTPCQTISAFCGGLTVLVTQIISESVMPVGTNPPGGIQFINVPEFVKLHPGGTVALPNVYPAVIACTVIFVQKFAVVLEMRTL